MDVAKTDLDIAYVAMIIHVYVASVYSRYFIYFRRMLQVFYLDVVYVAVAIHILQLSKIEVVLAFQEVNFFLTLTNYI
jgi:hypothetical protein